MMIDEFSLLKWAIVLSVHITSCTTRIIKAGDFGCYQFKGGGGGAKKLDMYHRHHARSVQFCCVHCQMFLGRLSTFLSLAFLYQAKLRYYETKILLMHRNSTCR
jgi:hypothetical protein